MKRYALLLYILFLAAAVRAATPRPQPLYIVNGKETTEIRSIPPEDIENVEMLPADEETIARYGQRAARGPPCFPFPTSPHISPHGARWCASTTATR